MNICGNSPKLTHFSNFLSHQTVKNRNRIPNVIFTVNAKNSSTFAGKAIFVPTKVIANQVAEIFIQSPENAFSQGLYCLFIV